MKVIVEVLDAGEDRPAVVRAAATALAARGWIVGDVDLGERYVEVTGQRDGRSVSVLAPRNGSGLTFIGDSGEVGPGRFSAGSSGAPSGGDSELQRPDAM